MELLCPVLGGGPHAMGEKKLKQIDVLKTKKEPYYFA